MLPGQHFPVAMGSFTCALLQHTVPQFVISSKGLVTCSLIYNRHAQQPLHKVADHSAQYLKLTVSLAWRNPQNIFLKQLCSQQLHTWLKNCDQNVLTVQVEHHRYSKYSQFRVRHLITLKIDRDLIFNAQSTRPPGNIRATFPSSG